MTAAIPMHYIGSKGGWHLLPMFSTDKGTKMEVTPAAANHYIIVSKIWYRISRLQPAGDANYLTILQPLYI
jgi:hypothetical protein